jgi:hypothetical protein
MRFASDADPRGWRHLYFGGAMNLNERDALLIVIPELR